MTTPELLKPTRNMEQARAEIAANDRRSWFPGTRALGSHGIISRQNEREVARFDSRADRDQVVAMARAFDDMRASLQTLVNYLSENDEDGLTDHAEPMIAARAALLKASGVRP